MREPASSWRVVVTIPEPSPMSWDLPPAELYERTDVIGGLRTLHELAVAAAASGREVELRGPVSRPVLDSLASAAGARPQLPSDRRRPNARDIVINIEGEHDSLRFARYLLSPARLVIALLAPTGQFGWPFVSPWSPESPLTVDIEKLGRPEHFRAMADLGIDIWTHMPPAYELARSVGARCAFIGNGEPDPVKQQMAVKDIPVVYLEANRWRPLAEQVAERMSMPVQMIPKGDHETIMRTLARSQVMLWPCRVEGDGRLLREARARGAVVVGLASNVYAVGLDEASGAIAVEDLEQMPGVVERLLADPERLQALAEAGRRSAVEQVDWTRYLERVDAAITAVEERPQEDSANARATFGERLGLMMDERERAVHRVEELDEHLVDAAARVRGLEQELDSAREVIAELGRQLEQARASQPATSWRPIRLGLTAAILRRSRS